MSGSGIGGGGGGGGGGRDNDWQKLDGLGLDPQGRHAVLGHADMVDIVVLPRVRDVLRFVPELNRFVVRDETLVWDSTPAAQDTAVLMVSEWIKRAVNRMNLRGPHRAGMLSQGYKHGVLACLAEQAVIIRRLELWDVNPWELQTPGGVVDLRWGTMRPTSATDFNLKRTAVTPEAGPAPLFGAMRSSGFRYAPEHEKYLKTQLGASLFGDNREHAIRWLIGTSQSGKSSLLGAVRDCLGDYGAICTGRLIAAKRDDQLSVLQQRAEMQVLARARFVLADEVDQHARVNSVVIKQITNNDLVRCEEKHQPAYTTRVQANVWVAVNNMLAGVEGGSAGLARRMQIVEMNGLPDQKDEELRDKLKAEHPQMLDWLVRAAHEWHLFGPADAPAGSQVLVAALTSEANLVPRWWGERWVFSADIRDKVFAVDLWHDFAQVWWPTQDEAKARGALVVPVSDIDFYRQVRDLIVRKSAHGDQAWWSEQLQIDGKRRSGYRGVIRRT